MKTKPGTKVLSEDQFKDLSPEDAWNAYSDLLGELSESNRYAQFQVLLERQLPKWVMPAIMIAFALLICFTPYFWRNSNSGPAPVSEKVDLTLLLDEVKKLADKPSPEADISPILGAIQKIQVPSSAQNAEATASAVSLMFTDGFIGNHPDHGKVRFFLGAAEDGVGELSWVKEE